MISVFLLTAMYYAPADAQSYAAEKQRENMLLDAVSDFAEGRYSMAEERLAPVIASDPDNDAAHYYMAMAKFMQEDYLDAEEEFEKAVALDSSNFWYRYRLAAVYAATGRQELTAEIYNGLLEDFPKKSELYYGLIDLYLSMGKMEEALSTLDQIDTVFGKSDISSITRFDILRNLGRIEEAYAVLEEYNREYSSPQVLAMLGDYQMSMYEDSVAMAYYDEALSLAPDYAPAMLGKAEVYRMTRKYDDYFRTLDIFMEDREIPSEGKCDYFKALVQHSDPNFLKIFQPRLDSVMTACLSAHPGDSSATALAGIYYYGTGREEKSKEYFRANADNWPESLGAAANYMEVLIYTGDWKELSSYTKLAYERFPEELRFLEMSTLADYNLKEYDDVIATCSRIISVAPQDSARVLAAYTTLGDVYYHLGEKSGYVQADAGAHEVVARVGEDAFQLMEKSDGRLHLCLLGQQDAVFGRAGPGAVVSHSFHGHLVGRGVEVQAAVETVVAEGVHACGQAESLPRGQRLGVVQAFVVAGHIGPERFVEIGLRYACVDKVVGHEAVLVVVRVEIVLVIAGGIDVRGTIGVCFGKPVAGIRLQAFHIGDSGRLIYGVGLHETRIAVEAVVGDIRGSPIISAYKSRWRFVAEIFRLRGQALVHLRQPHQLAEERILRARSQEVQHLGGRTGHVGTGFLNDYFVYRLHGQDILAVDSDMGAVLGLQRAYRREEEQGRHEAFHYGFSVHRAYSFTERGVSMAWMSTCAVLRMVAASSVAGAVRR